MARLVLLMYDQIVVLALFQYFSARHVSLYVQSAVGNGDTIALPVFGETCHICREPLYFQ